MNNLKIVGMTCVLFLVSLIAKADFVWDQFYLKASQIPLESSQSWPLLHNGRLKPFETLARETSVYLTGSYKFKGLHPIQLIFGIMSYQESESLPVIEVRFPELRKQLNLPSDRRHFSLKELQSTQLESFAMPLAEKQKTNRRALTELENKTMEAMEQIWMFRQIQGGALLVESMMPTSGSDNNTAIQLLKDYLQALSANQIFEITRIGDQINQHLRGVNWSEEIKPQLSRIDREVMYNKFAPFRLAGLFFFLLATILLFPKIIQKIPHKILSASLLIPALLLVIGFGIRISITGFAPVTNMYGTMIWVALGIGFFAWIFYLIYKNNWLLSLLYFGAFALLLLTEQIPLIISPDMDPIVAVLRSNLWLTLHVLTITISYAAFTIAMLLGNVMIIKELLNKTNPDWIKNYGHYCYRATQLGVFLLTIGIILGGVWADYSWGRFWGWDPKETWALIADLGFLILLHARFIGWVDSYRLLLLSPLAYLLVIMAWYGVNFILATGLHSYGFSSGGAQIVFTFIGVQIGLLLLAVTHRQIKSRKSA